jgi:hypothetical protein
MSNTPKRLIRELAVLESEIRKTRAFPIRDWKRGAQKNQERIGASSPIRNLHSAFRNFFLLQRPLSDLLHVFVAPAREVDDDDLVLAHLGRDFDGVRDGM